MWVLPDTSPVLNVACRPRSGDLQDFQSNKVWLVMSCDLVILSRLSGAPWGQVASYEVPELCARLGSQSMLLGFSTWTVDCFQVFASRLVLRCYDLMLSVGAGLWIPTPVLPLLDFYCFES